MYSRRSAVAVLCASALPAQAGSIPFVSDDGSPIRTFELARGRIEPSLIDAQPLGANPEDVMVVEWFDYNCSYCRAAGPALDLLLAADARLALALVHLPILSAGSMQAAAAQRAVYRRDGPESAGKLHGALLNLRGPANMDSAKAVCADLRMPFPSTRELDEATADVTAMKKRASSLGMRFTPTIWIAGTAMIGWPGPRTLGAMVAAARRCGEARCG